MAAPANRHRAADRSPAHIQLRARQRDVGAADADRAARAHGRRRIELARERNRASAPVDHQSTAIHMRCTSRQIAGHVNRIAQRPHNRGRAQLYSGARDRSARADQRIRSARLGWQGNLQKAVAVQIKRCHLARTQRDLAQRHRDRTCVRNGPAEQGGIPAAANLDRARVRHQRRAAIALECELAAHEIGIGDIQRRGDKTAADADGTARRDGDTVGVDQVDLAVAGQLPRDGRCGVAGHAVENCGLRIGLNEVYAIALPHRKARPVNHRTVAALGDGGGVGIRCNGRAAGNHAPALRGTRLRVRPCRTNQRGARQQRTGEAALWHDQRHRARGCCHARIAPR